MNELYTFIEYVLNNFRTFLLLPVTITIICTAFKIGMNFCRYNWTNENVKEIEKEIKKDDDLKKYFNYKVG